MVIDVRLRSNELFSVRDKESGTNEELEQQRKHSVRNGKECEFSQECTAAQII